VATYDGATTVRIHAIGYEDRKPSKQELAKMKALVRAEMENGALGVGSSLIYAPAFYADTEELIELAKVAAEFDGVYISHIRSEGNRLEEATDEFLRIVREANIAGEIYHLKAAGEANWGKRDAVIKKLEAARASRVWMPPCRRGCRKGVIPAGPSASVTTRLAKRSLARCELPATSGRTCCCSPDRRKKSCWWISRIPTCNI
jgi:hypothetical protein